MWNNVYNSISNFPKLETLKIFHLKIELIIWDLCIHIEYKKSQVNEQIIAKETAWMILTDRYNVKK